MSDDKCHEIKISATGTKEARALLRMWLDRFGWGNSWDYPAFWVGVVVGAILIAAMDIGDVHLCVGACN